jgi:hypothetical protein
MRAKLDVEIVLGEYGALTGKLLSACDWRDRDVGYLEPPAKAG